MTQHHAVPRVLLALLALVACAPPWQGSPIEPDSPGWVWLAEVDDLAADWRADPTLPSIDTVTWATGRPLVYLSPGESADGHGVTVRHETAHVLSWCTGRGLDYSHSHAAVWGPQGVVHVRPPRDPWRAAPRLLAR